MSDIGKGDWAEYVGLEGPSNPARGSIHQVVALTPRPAACEHCGKVARGLFLAGAPVPDPEAEGWSPCAWRPVYRPKSSFIEGLKQPLPPEKVEA